MDKLYKIREFLDKNYRAIYFNGRTLRQSFDTSKPITELDYPEFYDVCITSKCSGNCTYCYQDSGKEHKGYKNSFKKIKNYFGKMTENQKPFQIAYGGGNPNEHKDFIKILKWSYKNGITPNYTTNGMGINNKIVKATKKYCGGVAITCHSHLVRHWVESIGKFLKQKIKVNLHILISDKHSVLDFINTFKLYKNVIDYFVLLPMIPMGRCEKWREMTKETCDYLLQQLKDLTDIDKIAFGANFYPYVKDEKWLKLSLYEPEIMSKYLDLKDMKLYKSSFSTKPLN